MSVETVAVVDPRTGVAFKPEEVRDDLLVEIFTELERRERQMKEWRTAAEDELVRRYGDRRAPWPIGNVEVSVKRGRGRQWDAEDLMSTVSQLAQDGLLTIRDVQGLVTEEKTYKVDGRRAAELLSSLQGEALAELSRCFTWTQRSRPRVEVTPAASLEAGS